MSAPMSREAVDETLAGLGAAHDRIAAAMFTVDSHPALAYLRGGGLSGLTETRWAALQPEVLEEEGPQLTRPAWRRRRRPLRRARTPGGEALGGPHATSAS